MFGEGPIDWFYYLHMLMEKTRKESQKDSEDEEEEKEEDKKLTKGSSD